ncbi:glycerate kinase type-2 family protein [Inhella gelatinilytica]|uniref:Glycerate kinase n=1 Tax=Inhella gelatinilytica TaxID=2795030 RepID=A0A931IW36_9BURK|nr:glycerate kinase [Inhella gelatinilytica]MBH9553915.1 glycerate kinase [Inhella gelatinilytica]
MRPAPREGLRRLFETAVAAAQPARVLPAHWPEPPMGRTVVLGVGKAAWGMGAALEAAWPADRPLSGVLVAPAGSRPVGLGRLHRLESAHPVPDRRSVRAGRALLAATQGLGPQDLVIALLSGGASALATVPQPGLSFTDLQGIHQALLRCGAPIDAMNTLRKHLCALKGGQLAAACGRAPVLTLAISDIPGDRLDLIGSGPTLADPSTCGDALAVATRFAIPLPPVAEQALRAGTWETPKELPRHHRSQLVGSPAISLQAAADLGRQWGLHVTLLGDALQGEARALGRHLAQQCAQPGLYLSGGETTVTLTHSTPGRGGRNAECVLAALLEWRDRPGAYALMADTDGIDGASPWAGAQIGPDTWARAQAQRLDLAEALHRHDAGGVLHALGESLLTGPTGTNVNDFRALWIDEPPDPGSQRS